MNLHALLVLLSLCLVPIRPAPVAGETYENPDFGFKLRPPNQWSQMPLKTEEKWQVAKFLSDKTYFWNDKDNGWSWEHKPELTVIAFLTEVTQKKVDVEAKTGKDAGSIKIVLSNPYKDYLDYLKRTHQDGGFYVSDEKDLQIEGVPVHAYEIKVEKLVQTGPKTIVTWVFKQPDVEFAVQFVVLADAYPKLKGQIADSLRSFRLIPRTGGALPTDRGNVVTLEDSSKLTPTDRAKKRMSLESTAHEKAQKATPDGWDVFKTKRFLVISHADEKYARRVADHGESIFKWLEATFPFVGPEEYVRQPVLRICKDDDEYRSFWSGGWVFYFGDAPSEVVTYNDKSGFATGFAIEFVNFILLSLWFQERDRELWWAMPSWLRFGLRQAIETARADKTSGKLEFRTDDWEREEVRENLRLDTAVSPREMMMMDAEQFAGSSGQDYWGRTQQAGSFMRYPVAGPGAKDSRTKDLLKNYIRNLKQVITEMEAQEDAEDEGPDPKPKDEKEEEELFKRQQEKWKQQEKDLLQRVFERTFRSWTDSQWEAVEKSYLKSIGGK